MHAVRILLAGFVLLAGTSGLAANPPPGKSTRFATLVVGKKSYDQVEVRAVTARSISFVHSDGMASVLLRDLPPELQSQFGYSAEAEAAVEAKLAEARARAAKSSRAERVDRRLLEREQVLAARYESLMQELGQDPVLQPEVDLRPRFREFGLEVKNQGRRPSCAVFAIVSALEYQNARLSARSEKLSEEYLVWATHKSTRRVPLASATQSGAADADDESVTRSDAGFSLAEVVAALRAYGIPLQDAVPNTFGTAMGEIEEPDAEVVESARTRRRVFIHLLSPRHVETQIANIVHALNAEIPVAIGMRWPHARTLRTGYISEQKPILDYAHAVTLVGYRCPTGRIENAVFLFKNSYGATWGQGGYGLVTYGYLKQYLLDAVLLEVQRGDAF